MAELGLRLGCGVRPLLLLTCLFAPFHGKPGGGPAARAPYTGKATRGGPARVRVGRTGASGQWDIRSPRKLRLSCNPLLCVGRRGGSSGAWGSAGPPLSPCPGCFGPRRAAGSAGRRPARVVWRNEAGSVCAAWGPRTAPRFSRRQLLPRDQNEAGLETKRGSAGAEVGIAGLLLACDNVNVTCRDLGHRLTRAAPCTGDRKMSSPNYGCCGAYQLWPLDV